MRVSVASPNEREDVAAAKGGDAAAFERLYRANVGRVFALCVRMTGNRTMAEELTQDAFVRAWERLPSFRGECGFGTWLHRVAASEVVDQARVRARLAMREELEADPDRFSGSGHIPPHPALDVERAVAGLPPGARTVLVLHDLAGFTHQEIGDLTGLAEGTSKAHLHRARKLLREALA